jgi:N-acetylglucosamine-6-sulfatase
MQSSPHQPTPADRHKDLFNDYKVPRSESFNAEKPSGASWLRDLAQMNQTLVDYVDEFYRDRLRATQAVDELVEAVVKKLTELDLLDDT